MKRSIVLATVLALVAMAIPAFATDVTWSGELTYGFISDFVSVKDAYGNASLNFIGKVDANNTIALGMGSVLKGSSAGDIDLAGLTSLKAFTAYFTQLAITTDLVGALRLMDMGFAPMLTVGWYDITPKTYGVSGYGYEGVAALDPGPMDAFLLDTSIMKMLNVMIGFNPMGPGAWNATTNPFRFWFDVYGTFDPVTVSVFYYSNGKASLAEGQVAGDVKVALSMDPIAFAVDAQVLYDLLAASTKYGVGAKVTYGTIVTLGAGFAGSAAGLGDVGLNLNLVPMAALGADVDISLNLATGAASILNGVDVSGWMTFGKGKARVGYLYTTSAAGALNAPAALTNGGVYVTYDLTF